MLAAKGLLLYMRAEGSRGGLRDCCTPRTDGRFPLFLSRFFRTDKTPGLYEVAHVAAGI